MSSTTGSHTLPLPLHGREQGLGPGPPRANRAKRRLTEGGVVTAVAGHSMTADNIDFLGPLGFDAAPRLIELGARFLYVNYDTWLAQSSHQWLDSVR